MHSTQLQICPPCTTFCFPAIFYTQSASENMPMNVTHCW